MNANRGKARIIDIAIQVHVDVRLEVFREPFCVSVWVAGIIPVRSLGLDFGLLVQALVRFREDQLVAHNRRQGTFWTVIGAVVQHVRTPREIVRVKQIGIPLAVAVRAPIAVIQPIHLSNTRQVTTALYGVVPLVWNAKHVQNHVNMSGVILVPGLWLYSHLTLWFIVILESIILLALVRQVGVLLLRMGPRGALNVGVTGGPEIGKPAPSLPSDIRKNGGIPTYSDSPAGTVLIFASPTCGSCSMVPAAVTALATDYGEVAFCVAAPGDNRTLADYARKFPTGVRFIRDEGSITSDYMISDLPYAVFIDQNGIIRHKGIINNREHLEDLLIKGLAVCRHRRKQANQAEESVSV